MEKENGRFVTSIVKGVGIAVFVSLIGVLVFALIVKRTGISSSVVKTVVQFIKIISVFLGCFFSLSGSKGFVKGAILGLVYTLCVYLLFLIIGVNNFSGKFYLDMIVMSALGCVFGIVVVNARKSSV